MSGKFQNTKATILIIENDENVIFELNKILSSHYEIIVTREFNEGLNALRKNISDISATIISGNLPVSNKYECIQTLKNDKILCTIPVLVIIDSSSFDYEEAWLDAGATDFLLKPFNSRLVQERIKNIINLREATNILEVLEHDELTGLLTRQAFIHHAETLISQTPDHQYCIVGVDVENFKTTNTQYGEELCDQFLSYIAGQLISTLKTGFAGRFGGDQFVVIFEEKPNITEDLIRHIKESILLKAPIPHQTIKIGIYQSIDTALPVVRCCDRAFLAIREIKGVYAKDIFFYEDKLQQQLSDEQRITSCMEKALKENQFKVFYQPKHEAVTGKIAGAEALIRWEHPEYGFMSPGQFIPIFEKNGFITKIDSFVMNKVCEDLVQWQSLGIPVVPVSVNISRKDFFEKNWINKHLQLIDKYNLDHSLIHMEVTESMYSENIEFIIEQVKKVQDSGYLIEMDDFGSGYSSLGLLATFPLNVIKLDISFVRHIDVNKVVIENIIKMAHSMGFITVAEGAETKEEFKILKHLGCDLIQGYIFSKPLPSTEFEKYLRHNVCTIEPIITKFSLADDGQHNDTLLYAAGEFAEGVPGGFFTYHADGNKEIISFNHEILDIYECENAEEFRKLTGNSFNGMVHQEELPLIQASIEEQITDTNTLYYVEYRIKCKSGKTKYIRDYGRLVHSDKLGDIFYVFINDYTEEHNKEVEQKNINEVIQGISQTYTSIFLLDYETGKILPYAVAEDVNNNRSAELKATKHYNDFLTIYTSEYVTDEDQESMFKTACIENIKNELAVSNQFNFTFRLKEAMNGKKYVEMGFRKLKDENSSNRVVLTFRPVIKDRIKVETERNNNLIQEIEQYRRLEEDYKLDLKRAINKAETSEKSRKLFINNLSASLSAVMSEMLNHMKIARENISDIENLLNFIHKEQESHEKLSYIINNIVKLTKVENNEIDINPLPSDISNAIDKTKKLLNRKSSEKNINFETWFEVSNSYIYQDVTITAEYVIEVLLNAIKYTPENGTIRFGLTQYPGESDNECIIEFKCIDNGIGISEDFLPHIFEKFSREDNEINVKYPGSGIGLLITKRIIDLVGGTIEINSKPGAGTEVIIRTPHKYADPKDIPQRSAYIAETMNK